MFMRTLSFLAIVLLCTAAISAESRAEDPAPAIPCAAGNRLPFKAGERLSYRISWSDLVRAGRSLMEVRCEQGQDGSPVFRFVSTATSVGIVSRFYKVSDTVESAVDAAGLHVRSFRLDQRHGKRKKKKEMSFDREKGTVLVMNNGQQAVYTVPEDVQDPLSSLYYVRTLRELDGEKPVIVNVHEDDKTWAVEVRFLGRERLRTVLGEFNTIKVSTYPKYEGVFMSKGEIVIWLTDDERRIPLMMKSSISIGSIIATLTEMKGGDSAP